MIIVNVYYEEDYDPTTDGFHLHLAGVINDTLDLISDPYLIETCICNDPDFVPEAGHMYEIQLIRATIDSDPVPEPAFTIDRIIKKNYNTEFGIWETPLVRM